MSRVTWKPWETKPRRRWAYGDWVLSRIAIDGVVKDAIIIQHRSTKGDPVESTLLAPGYPPFRWESNEFYGDADRERVATILESLVEELQPA